MSVNGILTMLSPLAGYTDVGFRKLCGDNGCDFVVTEMVSAMALCQANKHTHDLLAILPSKAKNVIQLFGHDKKVFEKAVEIDAVQKFDQIDLNMGCPMPKIVRNGDGSALMLDLKKASEIISTVAKTSGKPVSVKFRKGFTDNNINAVEFAQMCQDSGAQMLTVHGRTKEQMYSGVADWKTIGEVVDATSIPVFANGDIKTLQDIQKVSEETRCEGVAVGRGLLGQPWLFSDSKNVDKKQVVFQHIEYLTMFHKEKLVVNEMRKHLIWYFKGEKGSKNFLNQVCRVNSLQEVKSCIEQFCH